MLKLCTHTKNLPILLFVRRSLFFIHRPVIFYIL